MTELTEQAKYLLEAWGLCQLGGRLKSAGIHKASEGEEGIDDGLRQWLHVEGFWDQGRNRQFRSMALAVFGNHIPLQEWTWFIPWEPRFRSCLRQGWGWVSNPADPLPEVWAAFTEAFMGWLEVNPLPPLARVAEASRSKKTPVRLISLQTASEISGVAPPTLRLWCREGRLRGAVKFGDWAVPMSEVVKLEKPKRGRPRKQAISLAASA